MSNFTIRTVWFCSAPLQRGHIKMSNFTTLMRRADRARRATSNTHHLTDHSWWTGYIRGLRRAHHVENYGTLVEHQLYLAAANDSDPDLSALGHGYAAGLKLQWATPGEPDDSLAHCAKCETLVVPNLADGDALCPYCNLVL
jgi:hypothetical protein